MDPSQIESQPSDVTFPGPQWDFLRRPGWQFIYVIRSLDLIKIGMAADVPARLKAMTCDNPHGIEVLTVFRVPNAVAHWAEMHCHRLLLDNHHHGEWFKADAAEVSALVRSVCELAAKARGAALIEAAPEDGPWTVKRSGPPASLRMQAMMRDMIDNPIVGDGSIESRRYQARKKQQRVRV